jgi:hypothetical protein
MSRQPLHLEPKRWSVVLTADRWNGAMVEPVRHRRTKGAETDMFEPKATASHLDSMADNPGAPGRFSQNTLEDARAGAKPRLSHRDLRRRSRDPVPKRQSRRSLAATAQDHEQAEAHGDLLSGANRSQREEAFILFDMASKGVSSRPILLISPATRRSARRSSTMCGCRRRMSSARSTAAGTWRNTCWSTSGR